ncbi:MAG: CPBP family intramembrane metalloprotease [Chitinophagaceae bacterium]
MTGHLRIKSPRTQFGLFLGLFGLCYLFTGIFSLLICNANHVPVVPSQIDWNDAKTIGVLKTIQGLSSIFMFFLPAALFALFTFYSGYGYYLGFKPAEKSQMYILAVVGILLALPLVALLGKFNEQIPLPDWLNNMEKEAGDQIQAFLKIRHGYDVWLNVFIIALLPAICEEMCFRGVLQRICIQIFRNAWVGIIVTSILFSALHFQFQGFFPRMFLGILLGMFYWYSGSLWTSIIAHFANNALQVIIASYMPKYAKQNPDAPMLAALACTVVVGIILWYYKKLSTVTYEKVYGTDEHRRFEHFPGN